jgi:hypothetical protein
MNLLFFRIILLFFKLNKKNFLGNINNKSSFQKTSKISEDHKILRNLIKIANDSRGLVNGCFNEIQKNQKMIEYLMTSFNYFNHGPRSFPHTYNNLYFSQQMLMPHPQYDPNELIKRIQNFNSISANKGILKVNEAEMVRSNFTTSSLNFDTLESFTSGKASL